jgi:hypothetical protein
MAFLKSILKQKVIFLRAGLIEKAERRWPLALKLLILLTFGPALRLNFRQQQTTNWVNFPGSATPSIGPSAPPTLHFVGTEVITPQRKSLDFLVLDIWGSRVFGRIIIGRVFVRNEASTSGD